MQKCVDEHFRDNWGKPPNEVRGGADGEFTCNINKPLLVSPTISRRVTGNLRVNKDDNFSRTLTVDSLSANAALIADGKKKKSPGIIPLLLSVTPI